MLFIFQLSNTVFTCDTLGKACTHKCVGCLLGLELPLKLYCYIYLHPLHKRMGLLLGHSVMGQLYFCCVDHSTACYL